MSRSPEDPPPPLEAATAGSGLTIPEISRINGHSKVALYDAVKRLNVPHLTFKKIRLYSREQADFLLKHMRSPESRSGKRSDQGASCRPS